MQTPKTRAGTLEVPQRTPKPARQLKTSGTDPDNSSSQSPATGTPKDRSPKVVDRRSPRTPTSEKKRPGRVSELETQLAQLQEELKKAKDQLVQSESWKKRAHHDAEEARNELAAMAAKLEESQQQLDEISACEESRVQELRKLSQDRDRAWESELEAVQKHHSMDSAALASAMNEIQKLKIQLEKVMESEATQAKYAQSAHEEILSLRLELSETLGLVEELKTQLNECKDSEARALKIVSQTQEELENVKSTEEKLRSEKLKAVEAYDSLAMELEKSKARVSSLEAFVSKLEANNDTNRSGDGDVEKELNHLKSEVENLKDALEGAERRYQEEYIQSTMQIRSAYELVEQTKAESCQKIAGFEAILDRAKAESEELMAKLLEKEAKLQSASNENKDLKVKLEKNEITTDHEPDHGMDLTKLESDLAEMKRVIFDKETELKNAAEENEKLIMEKNRVNDEARVAEKEALMKLDYLSEEADKSGRKVARVMEELDTAQAANAEMEAELRKLKVQSDQWRKAAEAAAAMLSGGNNNGKFVERTGSLDSHTIGGKLSSPYSEDTEDESPKKKNGNMLKKIGVLLKKAQK